MKGRMFWRLNVNGKREKSSLLIIFCVVFLFPKVGVCLITGEHGNRPVQDRGWPLGSVETANLPTRLGYWEGPPFGGGEYHFLYRCRNTDEFNEALKTFAAIQANRLELVVHNGPEYSFWLKQNDEKLSKAENRVDWTFTVWVPENWNRLYNSPRSLFLSDQPNFRKPVAAPRIDVYIGGSSIVWEDVNVPENLVVVDKRSGSVSAEFAGSGLVRGKVFDMSTGKPIAGAQIALVKREGRGKWKKVIDGATDEQGFCQIEKIPLGYYEIRIRAGGYASRKQGSYDNKRPEYHQFEVCLARPSYIKGTVSDVEGNPIEGVKVSANNVIGIDGFGYSCIDAKVATTDKEGRFEIPNLPTGFTNIGCRSESLHLKNSIFEVYAIPSDEIRLTMEGTGIIRGKVVDEDGRKPSGEVHIHVRPQGEQIGKWGGSARCKEDGSFKFTGVPPGEYLLGTDFKLAIEGERTNAKSISVEAGKTCEVEIVHFGQLPRQGPQRTQRRR